MALSFYSSSKSDSLSQKYQTWLKRWQEVCHLNERTREGSELPLLKALGSYLPQVQLHSNSFKTASSPRTLSITNFTKQLLFMKFDLVSVFVTQRTLPNTVSLRGQSGGGSKPLSDQSDTQVQFFFLCSQNLSITVDEAKYSSKQERFPLSSFRDLTIFAQICKDLLKGYYVN